MKTWRNQAFQKWKVRTHKTCNTVFLKETPAHCTEKIYPSKPRAEGGLGRRRRAASEASLGAALCFKFRSISGAAVHRGCATVFGAGLLILTPRLLILTPRLPILMLLFFWTLHRGYATVFGAGLLILTPRLLILTPRLPILMPLFFLNIT